MDVSKSVLRFTASDLVGHLNCHHLTSLDLAVARGSMPRPQVWDSVLAILADRGAIHERSYVEHLKQAAREVIEIPGKGVDPSAVEKTVRAMRDGADVIVQGALQHEQWAGRTDILMRVNTPSPLGAWSYEVIDTKLARETKAATILQLCLYSELLRLTQGRMPEQMYVVAPWTNYAPQAFRFASYAAYFRKARREFEQSLSASSADGTYPEPKEHCDVCRWRIQCNDQRHADDHLCLVPGLTKIQTNELHRRDIRTVASLALEPLPLRWRPDRGAASSYVRLREQARVQAESRALGKPLHEVLPVEPGIGLASLPEPSAGDIFLDIEGDPFAGEHGFEYLFGYSYFDASGALAHRSDWALTREAEKHVFERFVDFVIARWQACPDLHIYHYAPYEPATLKRLMGRYATREDEIDRMLRGALFVDLYRAVRNGVRASVESYSIKQLEKFFGFERQVPLAEASKARAAVEASLEVGDPQALDERVKLAVAGYNQDDCASALALRDWLEKLRAERIARGTQIDRPEPAVDQPSEAVAEWQARVDALVARLTANVPADRAARSPEQHSRWLLANVLDWHRRENKATYWERFRLEALSAEELREERAGLAGLEFVGAVAGTGRTPVHRYRFPAQECELRGNESLYVCGGEKVGSIESFALDQHTIDIKKRRDSADVHPQALFAHKDPVGTTVLSESLMRLGEHVADHGIEGEGAYAAARDLLLRNPPRLGGSPIRNAGEATLDAAIRVCTSLHGGVFAIQGPPGTGKTYTGASMICALVRRGAKVGITANSHTVIRKLLDDAILVAAERGIDLRCIQKISDAEDGDQHACIIVTKDNEEALGVLSTGKCQVAAGTAWFWAREDARESVDVLFVDEAAQMSLANVLAVSQAARTVVLLGDPQQLDQPMQGSHPEGTDVSALDHLLDGHKTIPAEKGLFLEETWRLHPDICAFTSELFYEGRLRSLAGLERQEIKSAARFKGSGLRYLPVTHTGNQSASPEEAETIRTLVNELLATHTTWVDRKGIEAPLRVDDILIIAPYNAQVVEIQDKLPGARIGTVDKFQGQQAPIVIYSMTTSTHADAPRGMNFLYSLKRLNVATSRARCLCILVCSPQLFEPECRTPQQMEMANAFCRYLELAAH